jgi:transposase InsO family protein
LEIVNEPKHRDLSVKQIVPRLADEGIYVASESTMYRILREEKQLRHRGSAKPRTSCPPKALTATGPGQVWSWDITYLRSPIRGLFFYLYIVIDVWSRKIVGAAVHTSEGSAEAAELLRSAYAVEGVRPQVLHLHSDNGSPMKGATLLGTLQSLGVVPSFSRPRVSDDNPYSEALFRTLKYRPEYPKGAFASIESARAWVVRFVAWYNEEHLHSGIRFVTPGQRHRGDDLALLVKRQEVYEAARSQNPERWTGKTRNWKADCVVTLNPERERIAS